MKKYFLKNYKYENLYSFQTDPSTGELTRLTFKDYIRVADGLFAYKTLKRYISFTIKGGEIYSYNKNSNGWELVDSWESTLNYIPIVPIITGISKNYLEITPKMYDIALLNKTLLNLESQLANVLSFIGNPIPMVFGDVIGNEDGEGMSIGTREGLEFENKKEHGLEYAEIEGASVEKLQEQIGKVITSITSLALNMNSAYNSSHTTIDAEHNTVKNLSYLTDIAEELENKFNKIVNIICDLSGTEFNEDVQLKFKKDFESKHFDIKYAEILNTMVSEGNLSLKTWYNILKSNNILPKELNIDGEVKTVEELKKKLNIKEKEMEEILKFVDPKHKDEVLKILESQTAKNVSNDISVNKKEKILGDLLSNYKKLQKEHEDLKEAFKSKESVKENKSLKSETEILKMKSKL